MRIKLICLKDTSVTANSISTWLFFMLKMFKLLTKVRLIADNLSVGSVYTV